MLWQDRPPFDQSSVLGCTFQANVWGRTAGYQIDSIATIPGICSYHRKRVDMERSLPVVGAYLAAAAPQRRHKAECRRSNDIVPPVRSADVGGALYWRPRLLPYREIRL